MASETHVGRVLLVHSGDPAAGQLAADLERLDRSVRVDAVDLETATGDVSIPRPLVLRLSRYGGRCLPALLVDDVVVGQGRLPGAPEALELIRRRVPEPAAELELERLLERVTAGENGRCCD